MISLTSKLTLESKVFPGARVHARKFNVKNRAQITLALAEYRAKVNDVYRRMLEFIPVLAETDEHDVVTKPGDPKDVLESKAIQRIILQNEKEALDDAYIKPAVLRHYVESIEGVELDGQPITADILTGEAGGGLTDFADEIYAFLENSNGLSGPNEKSSQSPLVSPIPADGSNPSTTATTASE